MDLRPRGCRTPDGCWTLQIQEPNGYRSPQMLNPKGYGTPMNTGSYKHSTPMDTGTSQMLDPIHRPSQPHIPPALPIPLPPHLPRLGVLHGAVRDDLGELHDPVVDFVPAPALHCKHRGQGTSTRTEPGAPKTPQILFWGGSLSPSFLPGGPDPTAVPSLCCARRFSSRVARGASAFLQGEQQGQSRPPNHPPPPHGTDPYGNTSPPPV